MEAAARVLDAGIAWLGMGPGDPVHDFGFSKNAEDTLARWGEDRIVDRLVKAYRRDRPDIVITTFLDVPGQHGHHRAMTRAAETAVALAADPKYRTEGTEPWQVARLYVPAWSGASYAYDDEVPPPSASVVVEAPGADTVTGAAFDQIGEWSRACHRSQGMGVCLDRPETAWPLHCRIGGMPGMTDIRDGLPADLGALAGLGAAQEAVKRCRAAFPDVAAIRSSATEAAGHVEATLLTCPPELRGRTAHRLERKLRELDAVIAISSGLIIRAWAEPAMLASGATGKLRIAVNDPTVSVKPVPGTGICAAPDGEGCWNLAVNAQAPPGIPFAQHFDALGGNGPLWIEATAETAGRKISLAVDLEEPLTIAPKATVLLEPDAAILDLTLPRKAITLRVTANGEASPILPAGWTAEAGEGGFNLLPPADLSAGVHEIGIAVDGEPAHVETVIDYPHIGKTVHAEPALFRVLAVPLAMPSNTRIGYVGGGGDRVGVWLARMGLDVDELDTEPLHKADLSRFTTMVVGIFAFGNRPDLAAATRRIHRWVAAGGHLVTLYHRPTDGWDPAVTPPLPLEIGRPSLRWRVTDPAAEVTALIPDHPLLTTPNRIGAADWAGWDKERGLYFAANRDPAYQALLSMSDPGEVPLDGALVSAVVGKGRHTHTGLVIHHQLDRLVPGAFRLLANLIQPAGA
jgi:LmbE family N-acetylglucosaminyl deacetylase